MKNIQLSAKDKKILKAFETVRDKRPFEFRICQDDEGGYPLF